MLCTSTGFQAFTGKIHLWIHATIVSSKRLIQSRYNRTCHQGLVISSQDLLKNYLSMMLMSCLLDSSFHFNLYTSLKHLIVGLSNEACFIFKAFSFVYLKNIWLFHDKNHSISKEKPYEYSNSWIFSPVCNFSNIYCPKLNIFSRL